MTLTRWKLMAGVFGLSACGIAALAEPACPKAPQPMPQTVAQSLAMPPSIPQPMPAPVEELPPALELPVAVQPTPLRAALVPVEVEPVTLPQVGVASPAETAPVTLPSPHYLNHTPEYFEPDPAVLTKAVEEAKPTHVPLMPLTQHPAPTAIALPSAAPVAMPPGEFAWVLREMIAAGEPLAQPMPRITLPTPQAVSLPSPEVAPQPKPAVQAVGYTATAISTAKKFKVLLQIGDTLPKFEIRDGEEVLLKVVADKVDVKSPTERSELWATLKAAGRVKFVTPGGEGVCDELQVVPGSGEVVAVGGVKFSDNWGRVETAVSSERMTFRLGSAPALAHGDNR